jgi:hypothetical protein
LVEGDYSPRYIIFEKMDTILADLGNTDDVDKIGSAFSKDGNSYISKLMFGDKNAGVSGLQNLSNTTKSPNDFEIVKLLYQYITGDTNGDN